LFLFKVKSRFQCFNKFPIATRQQLTISRAALYSQIGRADSYSSTPN